VVIGADLAFERRLRVGDTFSLRGRPFRVVGVVDKTLTGPDRMAFVTLDDAQALLTDSQPYLRLLREQARTLRTIPGFWLALLPAALRQQLQAVQNLPLDRPATSASVGWKDGENPEVVARRIRTAVPGVEVYSPAEMRASFRQVTLIFNLLILGSAIIALVVGGLAVMNTMTMAVLERTREIGLKRALGAQTGDILREYLTEAGLIGLLGGALGVGGGLAFTAVLNRWTALSGATLFAVTTRLEVLGLAVATGLGIASGVYPALRAVRLDCVRALREE
jgi:putative ABC transport system permease protein